LAKAIVDCAEVVSINVRAVNVYERRAICADDGYVVILKPFFGMRQQRL
jgi:hypothetical protein